MDEDVADVMELGRVLGALNVAGVKAERVEGEMLEKISPAEGVEMLAAERDEARADRIILEARWEKAEKERDEARRLYTEENLLRVRVEMERDAMRNECDGYNCPNATKTEAALERLRVAAAQAKEALNRLVLATQQANEADHQFVYVNGDALHSAIAALASLEAALGGEG